jgi:hypothetical protein
VRGLLAYAAYYDDELTIEFPTGSGRELALVEIATEVAGHPASTFLLDDHQRRPVFGGTETMQCDPAWRDVIPFYEYFHGDNGAGLGASHQTGWTGLVAPLLFLLGDEQRFADLIAGRTASADHPNGPLR